MAISKRITDAFESRTLDELVDPGRRITNGVRGPDWQDSEYKLIRLQDCKDWVVDAANAASISLEQFQENRRCKLEPEDIVVAIGGYVGNAAVFLDGAKAVIGQHSAVLPARRNGPADSRFLLTYLNSYYGEALFQRFVSGTVQPGVNLEDLRDLPAPLPHNVAQKYIGNKVRQAERMTDCANSLAVSANALVDLLVAGDLRESQLVAAQQALEAGDDSLDRAVLEGVRSYDIGNGDGPRLKTFAIRVTATDLLSRMNAETYAPHYLESSRKLNRSPLDITGLGDLVSKPINNSIRGVADALDVAGADIPMFRPADIADGVANLVTAPRITRDFEKEHEKSRVYPGDLVLGIAGSVGVLGRVPAGIEYGNINGSSARIATRSDQRSAYLLAYLQSSCGQSELLRYSVGSVQKHLNLEDLPLVRVPKLKEPAERYIGEKVRESEQRRAWAKGLIAVAKALVESLIDGQLTESQLIEAQQALDAGDDSLDRAILARFKTDGIDGTGEPLFQDLDQLYDVLKRATEEMTHDDD